MSRNKILVVDDESGVRFGIRDFLEQHGYEIEEAESCQDAQHLFRTSRPDIVIADYMMPDGTALDLPTLLVILQRLLQKQRNHNKQLASKSRQVRQAIDPFIGTSSAIRALKDQARRMLSTESPVLILGETGTGKGVLARWLHENSPRADEAFVDLNCAGLTRELLETELFGHEKGAFTSATASKQGLFEVAHRGTIFLDEVGDVDLQIQPKLLKVLEEKRFRRLGDV